MDRDLLVAAHRLIAARVRPVYAMNDTQPVSRTLLLERGSCSQRLAVLEAVGRACGIAGRVRGLLVSGRFWHPRFPRLRALVPRQVVLAWPEFLLDGEWVTVSELYGDLSTLREEEAFTNIGGETLFDAVARTAVDWDGVTASSCDLSGQVLADLGYFSSRDALFRAHGQTLCSPARITADLVMGRRSA
ncbi:transglutaminase domain-containing protein [Streptosporangium sp. NBC_01469]|uniref:transglutaminase domain-containing protein n=1 Tax=Streptosporangium sp. NBC_01469 TaxID=2903898 RepID=UPI002E283459|nr:transglutaminase domain-containing protein [Streptosporangium sp. NBC_01469]